MSGRMITAFAVGGVLGLVLGAFATGVAVSTAGDRFILKEMRSPFDLDKTVETITDRINRQPGWHVVKVYDYREEVRSHGGRDIGRMKIIKFCNGRFAGMMLSADDRKKIAAMLPKSIAVYEKSDHHVYVTAPNGMVIGQLFGSEAREIINEVSLDVENIMRFMNFKFTLF